MNPARRWRPPTMQMDTLDFGPAACTMARLVAGTRDEQLGEAIERGIMLGDSLEEVFILGRKDDVGVDIAADGAEVGEPHFRVS